MEIHGHCEEKFASLREEFARNFTERGDVGASFAATIEGEPVVDIWAAAEMLAIGEFPKLDEATAPEFMRGREPGTPGVMPPITNTDAWRQAEIPAANGHGNARSVVRAQTAIANGGSAFGVDLVSPRTIEEIFREQGDMSGLGATHGIGYGLKGLFAALIPQGVKTCFWGGAGGSTIILDHTNRLCMSYVMNNMHMSLLGDYRAANLTKRFYEGLGITQAQ